MARGHSVVVGGTRGIGRAVVRALAGPGQRVFVVGRRQPPAVDRRRRGVQYRLCDLADGVALEQLLREVIHGGDQVNNLVFLQRYRGEGNEWNGELAVSLTATRRIIETLADRFPKRLGGSIVVVSSVAAEFVADEQPVSYHVAKAGLDQMARYYARRLGPRRIRVNTVASGTVVKDESRAFYRGQRRLVALYKRTTPLGRMTTAEDVAGVIAFLCSPQAACITGQRIVVDGGLSLQWHESLARRLTSLRRVSVARRSAA